jgi:uncharacterized protein YdaU (DUF1376 family)
MPLFIGEYLADTMHLSTTEHGGYLLLLMAYWRNQGPLPDDDATLCAIARVSQCDWSAMRVRLAELFQVENGRWRHARLDEELTAAQARREAKSKAGKAGNAVRWGEKSQRDDSATRKTVANPIAQHRSSPSPSPIAGESVRAPAAHEVERPSLAEVKFYANSIGLAEWKAQDWFDEMEGCGWLDFNHRPVSDWKAILRRVKTKWEADGRPMQPPTTLRQGDERKRRGPEANQIQEKIEVRSL